MDGSQPSRGGRSTQITARSAPARGLPCGSSTRPWTSASSGPGWTVIRTTDDFELARKSLAQHRGMQFEVQTNVPEERRVPDHAVRDHLSGSQIARVVLLARIERERAALDSLDGRAVALLRHDFDLAGGGQLEQDRAAGCPRRFELLFDGWLQTGADRNDGLVVLEGVRAAERVAHVREVRHAMRVREHRRVFPVAAGEGLAQEHGDARRLGALDVDHLHVDVEVETEVYREAVAVTQPPEVFCLRELQAPALARACRHEQRVTPPRDANHAESVGASQHGNIANALVDLRQIDLGEILAQRVGHLDPAHLGVAERRVRILIAHAKSNRRRFRRGNFERTVARRLLQHGECDGQQHEAHATPFTRIKPAPPRTRSGSRSTPARLNRRTSPSAPPAPSRPRRALPLRAVRACRAAWSRLRA